MSRGITRNVDAGRYLSSTNLEVPHDSNNDQGNRNPNGGLAVRREAQFVRGSLPQLNSGSTPGSSMFTTPGFSSSQPSPSLSGTPGNFLHQSTPNTHVLASLHQLLPGNPGHESPYSRGSASTGSWLPVQPYSRPNSSSLPVSESGLNTTTSTGQQGVHTFTSRPGSSNASPYQSRPTSTTAATAPTFGLDYRNLVYVEPYDQNLVCSICSSPFVAPVKLPCEHVFCMDCVNTAVSYQPREGRNCPTCRRPLTSHSAESAQRLVSRMLEDLAVQCPQSHNGCTEVLTRATVGDHLRYYCGYLEVKCPSDKCKRMVQRRHIEDTECPHRLSFCKDCLSNVRYLEYEEHRSELCPSRTKKCPDCDLDISVRQFNMHRGSCLQARFNCDAAPYGCTFSSTREIITTHHATCPLLMLAPFLASQKTRLDEHSAALTQLRRENSVFRASLSNMQEMLGLRSSEATYDRPASDQLRTTQPSSETTEAHLLALHEDMRQEVAQLSQAISALDAKASTMIVNQGLCQTEEMAHANGVIGNLRMQVQYLIEAKQREQRAAMMRSRSTAESGAATLARVRDGSAGPAGGVEASANGPPVRRLSDSNRQDPKL